MSSSPVECIDRFYDLMSQLTGLPGQNLLLGDTTRRGVLSARGVYFFFDENEKRSANPKRYRVVRVGTHAITANSKATLCQRLRQHRGNPERDGNHRGSVFRLHVGAALQVRHEKILRTWGGSAAPAILRADPESREAERACEIAVSEYLAALRVIWIDVQDDPSPNSMRADIERNAIALLGNGLEPVDPPSAGWLGLMSPKLEIRKSGLWNVNHVLERPDLSFLDRFEECVDRTKSLIR